MLPVRTSVPDRAWIWSWVPEVQFGPATGGPEKVRGVEFRLGAVPQMVPPVIVRPPVVSEMRPAAEWLSVRVPPLVMELPPAKFIAPALATVSEPSFVTAGLLPLFPIVMVPASVKLPVDEMVRPVPSTIMLANEVPATPRARDPSTEVGRLTVRLRPFAPTLVPIVRAAPWATSSPDRLGDTLESTTVASAGMQTLTPLG